MLRMTGPIRNALGHDTEEPVMESAVRPYATAGIALVGASIIAIGPVAPRFPHVVVSPQVRLSAAVDPSTPWHDVINTAEGNFANLVAALREDPAPVLRQVIANQIGYLSELPDFEAIVGQISANLEAALAAPFATDLSTLDAVHGFIFPFVTTGLPGVFPPLLPAELQPLLNLTTTYLSGVLLGAVGPVIGPGLALGASTQAIINNLTGDEPDPQAALNDLINIPAGMTDAFLNGGQVLDVTPVLSALAPVLGVELPEGTSIGVAMGGLLSPGGSLFNALDITVEVSGVPLTVAGQGPGAIGSLIGLPKVIADAITPPSTSATVRSDGTGPAQVPTSILSSRTPALPVATDKIADPGMTVNQTHSLATNRNSPESDAARNDDIHVQAARARAQVDSTVKRATLRTNNAVNHVRDQIEKSMKRATDQLNEISKNSREQIKKTVAGGSPNESTGNNKVEHSQPDSN
jgi:hypothetical protein